MALNLKRKRGQESGPHKTRKLAPDEEDPSGLSEESDGGSVDEESEAADEEEWGGVSVDVPIESTEQHGRPKRPPTGEELREMKDASELFKSSSFKLQIDALLPNVRSKPSRIAALERFLLRLHPFLTNIRPVAPQHPLHASRSLLKKGVSVPYSDPLPTEETKWKVAYQPPSDIALVGSWANKISVKGKDESKFGVDLAVDMPDELFQDKDYLNGRFFHKRAFYLATIAAALTQPKTGLDVDVAYQSMSDDPRLTKLVLTSDRDSDNGLKKLNAQICIIPVISSSCPVSIRHLSPTHSNIRIHSSNEGETTSLPTPIYNAAILTHTSPKHYLLATHDLKKSTLAFCDAVSLLRVWANQRGFGQGTRMCVRGFESKGPFWAAVLDVVIHGEDTSWTGGVKSNKTREPLGRGLSSYQLFRAALDFLAKRDWESEPVFMLATNKEQRFPVEHYRVGFPRCPIFVDGSSPGLNLLSDVPLGSMKMLSLEARNTIELLNRPSTLSEESSNDSFSECFLKDHRDIFTRFDSVLRVDLSTAKPRAELVHSGLDRGSAANALFASLASTMEAGLGNRTKAIVLLQPSSTSRPLSQAHPASNHIVHIGLIYDEHNAFRQVDHGPSAATSEEQEPSEETKRFRELWGSKAELRRFRDGRILESVVWDVRTADEKAVIPLTIVRYLLGLRFGVEHLDADASTLQAAFDPYLRLPPEVSRAFTQKKEPLAIGFRGAITACENLSKQIRALEDKLPLSLLLISPASSSIRYTSALAPIPLPTSLTSVIPSNMQYLEPMQMVLQFEKSAKWPDDLRAIQKIKLAFFERIARDLMVSVSGLEARVVVASRSPRPEIEDQARLEIITPDGWAFEVRVWHDREATLLDRILEESSSKGKKKRKQSDNHIKAKDRQDALQAKTTYVRNFLHAPLHHRAVAALSHRFGAYAGTVRLVKRWLASHWLLDGHAIAPEAVEILCARFFVYPGWEASEEDEAEGQKKEKKAPATKGRGFALVVEFLKNWDWRVGLHVPLYGRREEKSDYKLPKGTPVSGVWRLKTELDPEGIVWTSDGPDAIVAQRIKDVAKATWGCLQEAENGRLSVKQIFTHSLGDYDFVVHLNTSVLSRYGHNVLADPSKFVDADTSRPRMPGFDPARALFNDLQRVYADTFKIFYDPLGGDKFGGAWEPSIRVPKPFRVRGRYSSMPEPKEHEKSKKDDQVRLNEDAVLSEIERMGQGLVEKITVRE